MMAHRLIRSLRRTATPIVCTYKTKTKTKTKSVIPVHGQNRGYVSEMRKSAFEANILRLLRNEIQYELEHSPPPPQPVPEFNSFTIDGRPGEQWIRLNRKFGENEELKVEVTMFDGSVPVNKAGGIAQGGDVQLHVTMIVDIFKGKDSDVLEFVCSTWPDSIEIQRVFMRRHDRMAGQPYMGPRFKELDDELQDLLYEFLEARGVNDDLAVFLHEYMKSKDKKRGQGDMKKECDQIQFGKGPSAITNTSTNCHA